jgi:hypothetical protein
MSAHDRRKTREEIHVDLADPVPLPTWKRRYLSGLSRQGWGWGINRPYRHAELEGTPALVVYLILAMFLAILVVGVLFITGVL